MRVRPFVFSTIFMAFSRHSLPPVATVAPPQVAQAGWRIAATPRLDIGTADGPPETMFARVAHATRMRDGRVVVLDQGNTAVRVFDSKGKFLTNIGRKGSGPGEYRYPNWASIGAGDTLHLYDYGEGASKMLLFTSGGAFVRADNVFPGPDAAGGTVLRLLPDGSLLIRGSVSSSYRQPRTAEGYRGQDGVVRWRAGDSSRLVAKFPGQVISNKRSAFNEFGVQAASDSFVFAGVPTNYSIAVHSLDGTQRYTITKRVTPVKVTAEHIRAYEESLKSLISSRFTENDMRDQLSRTSYPEYLPAFGSLKADKAGNLWVSESNSARNRPSNWTVFRASGQQLAEIAMPAGFYPFEIGDDYVLGTWRDDDDVQHVRLYDLVRK